MPFLNWLRRKSKPDLDPIAAAAASLDKSRLRDLFSRPPSFSFIAIPGDAGADIPAFLTSCGYTLLAGGEFHGPFASLYAGLNHAPDADTSIERKAWFLAAGYTILVDPSMTLNTDTDRLASLARNAGAPVIAAIWERGSETVALVEVSAGGLSRQSWHCQGTPDQEQKNPYPEIAASPTNEGLRAALRQYGLTEDAVFGPVHATVAELKS